eukprot:jgi/Psemu1/11221/gm1.11221_g
MLQLLSANPREVRACGLQPTLQKLKQPSPLLAEILKKSGILEQTVVSHIMTSSCKYLTCLSKGHSIIHLRHQTMLKFQSHMIARGENTSHMKKVNLEASLNFQKEGGSPLQLLMGATDHWYCVLLGLAIYQKVWLSSGEAKSCKTAYQKDLKAIIKNPALNLLLIGSLALTLVGATKDDMNYRATRWKTRDMQDSYAYLRLDWLDIHAASKLFAPAIRVKFGHTVGAIFAKPLLWVCFNASATDMVSPGLKEQILN